MPQHENCSISVWSSRNKKSTPIKIDQGMQQTSLLTAVWQWVTVVWWTFPLWLERWQPAAQLRLLIILKLCPKSGYWQSPLPDKWDVTVSFTLVCRGWHALNSFHAEKQMFFQYKSNHRYDFTVDEDDISWWLELITTYKPFSHLTFSSEESTAGLTH